MNELGLFKKRDKEVVPEKEEKAKAISDKSYKEKSPNSLVLKRFLRVCVWVFLCFILMRGCISFTQGTKVVNQTIINGVTQESIPESVKGFAADFAQEYFTWTMNQFSERSARLSNFISGIESDAGLRSVDIKGSSRVVSIEVYDSYLDTNDVVQVTLLVRREVTIPSTARSDDGETVTTDSVVSSKVYMIVPVSKAEQGLVIKSYPRFVTGSPKAEIENRYIGASINDSETLEAAKELMGGFLKSWYEGNLSQLKYFYLDDELLPSTLLPSDFKFDRVESINLHRIEGKENAIYLQTNVIVISSIGESFTNAWTAEVNRKDGRLYIVSFDSQEKEISTSPTSSPATTVPNNSESNNVTPISSNP